MKIKRKHPIIALILAMLLVYPNVFSFSHVLTHHHQSQNHSIAQELTCKLESSNTSIEKLSSLNAEEICPICNYDFSFAVENNISTLKVLLLSFADQRIGVITTFIVNERCKKTSSRAPPFAV